MIAIDDKNFIRLTEFMHKNYGINLSKKRTLIESRLSNLLVSYGISEFSQYLDKVFQDNSGHEMTELLNRLTTNLTYFMRESVHFDFFTETVLPWLEKNNRNKDLRVWSAGCSTGEEAYTLAMLIDNYFGVNRKGWDTKILATDISQKALGIAKKGIYTSEALEHLPNQFRSKYFKKLTDDTYEICDSIKNEVVFAPFNLMEPKFDFKKNFQVIFCRNVMIYFDKETKEELIQKFYQSTESGGYLFIGHSESIERNSLGYKYVMPSLYRKV